MKWYVQKLLHRQGPNNLPHPKALTIKYQMGRSLKAVGMKYERGPCVNRQEPKVWSWGKIKVYKCPSDGLFDRPWDTALNRLSHQRFWMKWHLRLFVC